MLQTIHLQTAIADDTAQPTVAAYDEPFLTRLSGRDTQAFDQMVLDQAPRIQSLVSRLLGWDSDCDDVVQEVFIVAWEKIDRFRGDAQISTWLYAIAINQCRRRRRQRGSWKKVFQNLCERRIPVGALSESIDTNTDTEMIHDAINELSQKERELIVLCSLEEKSPEQAAQLLGVRKNTLEVRLHRARHRLKQIINTKIDERNP